MQKSLVVLSIFGMTNLVRAEHNDQECCDPDPPETCCLDECKPCHCLGPENYGVNAPACPRIYNLCCPCDSEVIVTVAGFYWNAHQDGMEYALKNKVVNPGPNPTSTTGVKDIQELNNLNDAKYESLDFEWDFGFKVGLAYCSPCDGWDFGILWTRFRGEADDHSKTKVDGKRTLLPLWAGFAPAQGNLLYATDIEAHWKLKLDLIDIELGRSFWTSKYLSIRPHVGIRIAFIDQKYDIEHKGGSWDSNDNTRPNQPAFKGDVELENDFRAVGVRSGIDSLWNLGCCWAIYGNLAASIVFGRFCLDHDEENKERFAPHSKTRVLSTDERFSEVTRAIFDLALGIQWSTLFCNCRYGLVAMLGWEQHLFFHQNQMWRVNRIGDIYKLNGNGPFLKNKTGENVFFQRHGDLSTQGFTFTLKFEF